MFTVLVPVLDKRCALATLLCGPPCLHLCLAAGPLGTWRACWGDELWWLVVVVVGPVFCIICTGDAVVVMPFTVPVCSASLRVQRCGDGEELVGLLCTGDV